MECDSAKEWKFISEQMECRAKKKKGANHIDWIGPMVAVKDNCNYYNPD